MTFFCGYDPQLPKEAPAVLVFVADPFAWRGDNADIATTAARSGAWNTEFQAMFNSFEEFRDRESRGLLRENAIKNAMIAATYAMLAATSHGLASAPMNGWDADLVKKAIGIDDPDDLPIAVLVTLGYSDAPRPHPGRRDRARNVVPVVALAIAPAFENVFGAGSSSRQRRTGACRGGELGGPPGKCG